MVPKTEWKYNLKNKVLHRILEIELWVVALDTYLLPSCMDTEEHDLIYRLEQKFPQIDCTHIEYGNPNPDVFIKQSSLIN